MRILKTESIIDAPPQTVWAILDDLSSYSEWNPLMPDLHGLTILDETVTGRMLIDGVPAIPVSPRLTRIVGARELRWISVIPGDKGFSAEHYFILEPRNGGGTRLIHEEIFQGPGSEELWELFDHAGRAAYNKFNKALKRRAETACDVTLLLHPCLDDPSPKANEQQKDFVLRCWCNNEPVEVQVSQPVRHNHLCGCSKCWRPPAALFAQTALVPTDALKPIARQDKLKVIEAGQTIRRHACVECGVHLYGRVDDSRHHFFGVDFIHPELSVEPVRPAVEFAGFVSSVIGQGVAPHLMGTVRSLLALKGIAYSDAFSPEIMDLIAWHEAKIAASGVAGVSA